MNQIKFTYLKIFKNVETFSTYRKKGTKTIKHHLQTKAKDTQLYNV